VWAFHRNLAKYVWRDVSQSLRTTNSWLSIGVLFGLFLANIFAGPLAARLAQIWPERLSALVAVAAFVESIPHWWPVPLLMAVAFYRLLLANYRLHQETMEEMGAEIRDLRRRLGTRRQRHDNAAALAKMSQSMEKRRLEWREEVGSPGKYPDAYKRAMNQQAEIAKWLEERYGYDLAHRFQRTANKARAVYHAEQIDANLLTYRERVENLGEIIDEIRSGKLKRLVVTD
jgi:hypothetical protein